MKKKPCSPWFIPQYVNISRVNSGKEYPRLPAMIILFSWSLPVNAGSVVFSSSSYLSVQCSPPLQAMIILFSWSLPVNAGSVVFSPNSPLSVQCSPPLPAMIILFSWSLPVNAGSVVFSPAVPFLSSVLLHCRQ